MTESKHFRIKRAADTVVRLASEWSRAYRAWIACDTNDSKEDRLFDESRLLRKRLEGAAHELAALEDER